MVAVLTKATFRQENPSGTIRTTIEDLGSSLEGVLEMAHRSALSLMKKGYSVKWSTEKHCCLTKGNDCVYLRVDDFPITYLGQ